LTVLDREFWRRVEYRREKLAQAISIKKARDKIIKAVWPASGAPPFAYRPAFEIAGSRAVSRAEYEEARRLFLARVAMCRAQDERPIDVPGKIGRVPYVRPAARGEEYALGVHGLELDDAIRKAGRKRAGIWTMAPNPLSNEDWGKKGENNEDRGENAGDRFSIEDLTCCGFLPEEIAILSAHLRSLRPSGKGLIPGRGRGRPSIHGKAMTSTERSRRHRAKKLA
jgi:hypothetical protein